MNNKKSNVIIKVLHSTLCYLFLPNIENGFKKY